MTAHQTADVDKPHRGRRLTWEEFRRLTGREPPKAVNDNGGSFYDFAAPAHFPSGRPRNIPFSKQVRILP